MEKTILLFDPEVSTHESLHRFLRVELNSPKVTLTTATDAQTFVQSLTKHWCFIIINFWTPYFWETGFAEIDIFVRKIQRLQSQYATFPTLIALTPDEYQKQKLETRNFLVVSKSLGVHNRGTLSNLPEPKLSEAGLSIDYIKNVVCEEMGGTK